MNPTDDNYIDENAEMCFIEIKPLSYFEQNHKEKSDDGFFLNDQWFMYEFNDVLPAHRTIYAMKEEDYFVVKMSNDYEYRVQAEWCTVIEDTVAISRGIVYYTPYGGKPMSLTPEELAQQQEAARLAEEAAAEERRIIEEQEKKSKDDFLAIIGTAPKVFAKPKGKVKKNVLPIEVGDTVLIVNKEVPQLVTAVDSDTITVQFGGTFSPTEVYPYYVTIGGTKPELGDIALVLIDGEVKSILLTSGELLSAVQNTKYCSLQSVLRNTGTGAKCFARGSFKVYSSGEVIDTVSGKQVDPSVLNDRFKPVVENIKGSFEIELIARHYGINVKDVKPKEVQILKTLEIVLDNPECAKDKEWALIVGPSGSGKTTVAVEYAESKNLEYIIQGGSAQLTVDDLLGYNSITTGEYFPSLLRDAIENGKVFILDEIDACNINTLLSLNAFKRDIVQFPDKLVKVHHDFRLIATANTLNYSEDYNGRSAMDRATIKRFSILFYDLTQAEIAVRYGFEETKELAGKMTGKKAYSTSEYRLIHGCILEPTGDYDPRDIQRIVRNRRLEKEGAFNF